jgi:hypothetical protein
MSYLDTLRFHFAGRFFSNPSTVNNHPAHWNSGQFDRSRHWKSGIGGGPEHGWWNPEGANLFRLETVTIKSAAYEDGSPADPGSDGLFRFRLASPGRNPGKMVDLDPDQQLVSMIFGLDIALVDDAERTALQASFEAAPFTDIWRKGPPPGGDEAASVAYQSILHVRSWGDLTSSKFLQQLRQAATDNILSIKFNLDGYSMNAADAAKFAKGRIVGTIGPAKASEPRHWVKGRHFGNEVHPAGSASPGFITNSGVNYFVAVHDQTRGQIRLDLGNALPVSPAGGPNQDIGRLFLGWRNMDASVTEIAEVPYLAQDWYETTAGIIELPPDRALTAAETDAIAISPLCIVAHRQDERTIVSQEACAHVRADLFVARLDPGDSTVVRLHASRLGRPLANTRINLAHFIPPGRDAAANFPVSALRLPRFVLTDAAGNAEVAMAADDPGNPRFFQNGHVGINPGSRRVHVDGQVYMIGYEIDGEPQPNPSNFLSVLVWNNFVPDEPPTWEGSMGDVFVQYGNLYPWMTNFGPELDLADYDQVADAGADILQVLSLAQSHAHYMPVTRDLSKSRRDAMVRWLTQPGPDGRPRRGTAPVAAVAPPTAAAVVTTEANVELGSKMLAGQQRRLVRYRPE